jgi:dienelactone hydrolase
MALTHALRKKRWSLQCVIALAVSLCIVALVALAEPQVIQGTAVPTTAPRGTEDLALQWFTLTGPQHTMLAAVARPEGPGPFPAVILLHGTHGFAREYVQLARDLARGGRIAIAVCWFAGGSGAGTRFVTPVACPDAPPMPKGYEARSVVGALVRSVRSLPGVRGDRIALMGHSRGGGASLDYALSGGDVQSLVLNSAPYTPEFIDGAGHLRVPVLMLHGNADSPAEGGSAMTDVALAKKFETALRTAGKTIEAKYYESGKHNSIFVDPGQRRDELQRIDAFLRQRLSGD